MSRQSACKLIKHTGEVTLFQGTALSDRLFYCILDKDFVDLNVGSKFNVDITFPGLDAKALVTINASQAQVQVMPGFEITRVNRSLITATEIE